MAQHRKDKEYTQKGLAQRLRIFDKAVRQGERDETTPDVTLDWRMNSEIEPAFVEDRLLEAYICNMLLDRAQNGDVVDTTCVRRFAQNAPENTRSNA